VIIAQMKDLSLKVTIYRSEPILYRSNPSQTLVNLVRHKKVPPF